MEEKPTYEHDCDGCRFIGTYKESHHWQDLYLCDRRIVVVRNGNPENTYSMMVDFPHPHEFWAAANWGLKIAKSKGML